jgi:hypothetical protein
MNDIVNQLERIFRSHKLSFKAMNDRKTRMLLLESSNAERLKKYFKKRFRRDIDLDEAKDLEVLLLTYQYIANN